MVKEQDGSISAYIEPGRLTRAACRWTEYGHELVLGGRKGKGGVSRGQRAGPPVPQASCGLV